VKLSVITPTLNSAESVETAIGSVLEQNDPDFEHVVVDGGSTDGTLDILKRYPHLTWASEPDSGQADAMNKGFEMSTGDVVSYLNADDAYEPGAFAEVRRCFDAEPDLAFLVGRLRVFREGKPERIADPNVRFKWMLRFFDVDAFPMNPVSCFYRRKVQEAVGGYDTRLEYAMDYRFLLEAARRFELKRTRAILGRYVIRPGTKTYESTATDRRHWQVTRFSTAYYRFLPPRDRLMAYLWYATEARPLPRKLIGPLFGKLRAILKLRAMDQKQPEVRHE
jgi:glycosyltransferase involved in cell wall biosynthesis